MSKVGLEKLAGDFAYVLLLYVTFSLLIQTALSLSPKSLLNRTHNSIIILPLYLGVSLGIAGALVDLLAASLSANLLAKRTLFDYSIVAGVFIGEYMYCALAHACDFAKCKMPAFKLEEAISPCRGYTLAVAVAYWIVPASLLFLWQVLWREFYWQGFVEFSIVAWSVTLLQLLWKKLSGALVNRTREL